MQAPAWLRNAFRFSDKSSKPALTRPAPSGAPGTLIWRGYIDDVDQNPEVRGDKWYGTVGAIGIGSQMVRDPYVRSSLKILHNPLLAAIWDFKPASSDPLDIEVARFCRWNFFERLNWQDTLRKILYYHRDGVSLFEPTTDTVELPRKKFPLHPGGGIGVAYTGMHHRPAWTIQRWNPKRNNPEQLESVDQYLMGGDASQDKIGFVNIPGSALLRFTYEQEGSNFTGLPLLRSAYGAWKMKRIFQTLLAIMFERHGVGIPVLTLPENAGEEEIALAEQILAELRAHEKAYLQLPNGYTFKWELAAGLQGMAAALADAIRAQNKDIATNVMTGYMQLGDGGGSYALAESQSAPSHVNADCESRFICDTLYYGSDGWSPVGRLVSQNYGSDVELPRPVARNLPTRDWLKAVPEIYKAITAGAVRIDQQLRDFLREVLLLPPEDVETLEQVLNPQRQIDTEPATESQAEEMQQ
jgi:hypothetical protein